MKGDYILNNKNHEPSFHESPLCKNQRFCIPCRNDRAFREKVAKDFNLKTPDFNCPLGIPDKAQENNLKPKGKEHLEHGRLMRELQKRVPKIIEGMRNDLNEVGSLHKHINVIEHMFFPLGVPNKCKHMTVKNKNAVLPDGNKGDIVDCECPYIFDKNRIIIADNCTPTNCSFYEDVSGEIEKMSNEELKEYIKVIDNEVIINEEPDLESENSDENDSDVELEQPDLGKAPISTMFLEDDDFVDNPSEDKSTEGNNKIVPFEVVQSKDEETPRKIVFVNGQSPGDGVALVFAIRSLHETHPGKFITDLRCPYGQLVEGDPCITPLDENDPSVEVIQATYETIHESNQKPHHFIMSFLKDMETAVGVNIKPTNFSGFLHINEQEKYWYSAVYQELNKDVPYWIIDAGYKNDYSAKQWEFERYQAIVDACPEVTFVQIGHRDEQGWHVHPELKGDNLIDMVGKTDLRQLMRLVYNSFGVITPVSMPMMMAYAVPPHPRFRRNSRACIVIAGGREANHWQMGPNHQYLHACGMLDCCDMGGCWKSRMEPLDFKPMLKHEVEAEAAKNASLCLRPVVTESGQKIARCMDMIKAEDVIKIVKQYMEGYKIQLERLEKEAKQQQTPPQIQKQIIEKQKSRKKNKNARKARKKQRK